MIRKIFSAFLCLAVAFVTVTASLSANEYSTAEAAKVYETPYYYKQLSDNAKKTYSLLKKAILNCKKSVKTKYEINETDFEQIAELLIFHDPMTFNLENIEVSQNALNSYNFKLSYRYGKETFDEMSEAYKKEANKILDKLDDDMSVYKKIRTIHDSIIESTVYDLDDEYCDTIYGTLVENKGKCDGYSKSFSYICGQAGIRTVTVIGDDVTDNTDVMHMWNKVYYNKNWYNVDVTWDDPVGNIRDNLQYDFFMISDKAIEKTHTEDNFNFDAPDAEDDSKDYFTVNKKYADSLDSAKAIFKKGLISASEDQKYCVPLKCSSKEVYDEVKKYIFDTDGIHELLKSVNDKTENALITDIYSYKFNENQYIVSLYVFYEDTDLDHYFTSTDEFSDSSLKSLAHYGVD